MRIRHKPYARPELAAWPYFIDEPEHTRGRWAAQFAEPALPIRLELGCGKGGFLAAAGLRDTGYNHLGLDIKSEVLVVAKRRIESEYELAQRRIDNILLASYNIEHIDKIVAAQDGIDRIYINFCNPWYKSGHAKHRLTHPRQLIKYRDLLRKEGEIWFKTDDDPLFSDTLRYLPMVGFEVRWRSLDLHSCEPEWNLRTEHEEMFAAEGRPIKALCARFVDADFDREKLLLSKDV